MNTTGIQNYLSNVFHPVYTFDPINSNFTPKLELSNIDTYSGNVASVFRVDVGDSNSNVYVGSNAGNAFDTLNSCSNVTAVGYGAASGISNVSNSVFVGWYAGANTTSTIDVISIGKSAGGNGSRNIYIGTSNGTTGNNNILIGHYISPTAVSNQIRIGYSNQIPIAADLSRNWVGLGGVLTPINGTGTLDVSGSTRSTGGYVSIQSNISVGIGSQTIGTIKKGIIHVSAIDASSSANRAAYTYFAWTTSNVSSMASTSNGDTDIVTSGTDIQISNTTTTKTYGYSITYFPLP
jgi:hypothetical protein